LTTLQKYLSYIHKIVVEKTTSEFNPQLIVAIQNGKYVLNAQNANYSYASLHRVFQQALKKIDLENASSVLVLGCGAGSIPNIIYNELNLSPKMDAVEIDVKVIELGKKYFELDKYPNLNIVVGDALNFVKTTDAKYDLVLVDLFRGIDVPSEFLTQHFFEQLKSLLTTKGELLLNYVAYNYETKQRVVELKNELKGVFHNNVNVYQLEGINRVFHVRT